jgi:hypothetical protein
MAVETFGVTAAMVQRHYFPTFTTWSGSTIPTTTAVGEMIDAAGGRLTGALLNESIPVGGITAGTAAYAACQDVMRMLTARRVLECITGVNPALAQRLDQEIAAWFKSFDESGATFLGDDDLGSLSESDPDGPTHHIDEYVLPVSTDNAEASDATLPFRKDDLL